MAAAKREEVGLRDGNAPWSEGGNPTPLRPSASSDSATRADGCISAWACWCGCWCKGGGRAKVPATGTACARGIEV
eukprot:CAMPEP_0179457924 /NCGR_PEP_ID=MMETSP0799-20121207/41574_1 /TAXON_ID=46947 /ORGANISM="Geminigera cryophila, Strain CCMP2564" /LENGTH=75 /DNA_ID=CAMNT_0021258861 /DNA_START=311 /DNA_END=538 /DNA_ORIENTATION=-